MRISDWSSDVCSSDLHPDSTLLRIWCFQPGSSNLRHMALAGQGSWVRSFPPGRWEERRVGKECVSPCRSRWCPYHSTQKNHIITESQRSKINLKHTSY